MGICQDHHPSSPSDNNSKNFKLSNYSNLIGLDMKTKEDNPDEREEGEIVDDFEDIISSDEELSMRKRIEELEAKNAELEKIANISVSAVYNSGGYNEYPKKDSHHLDRYPLVSINISDDEEYPPAPKMPRISKRRKSTQHSTSRHKLLHTSSGTSSNHRRRKRSSSPPPAPSYRPSDKLLLSLFHEKVAAASQNDTHSSNSRRKRKTKKTHSKSSSLRRKSREYYANDDDFDNNVDIDQNNREHVENSDCDKSYSLNRDELRLALARNTIRIEQHAPLKDRLSRRKENTDMYNFVQSIEDSPRDEAVAVEEDDEVQVAEEQPPVSPPEDEKHESDDSLEEQELRILALKSAMLKKHQVRKKRNENVAYSPSDFDEIYKCISPSPSLNNIDDQDACNSMEISPAPSPKMVLSDDGGGIDTKPVDMDIVNSDSECELPAYDEWIPIEQIPLPNNIEFNEEIFNPTPVRFNVMPPEVRYDSPSKQFDSEVDEEELALRALLLSKMNSPKVSKLARKPDPPMTTPLPVPPPLIPVENVPTPDPDLSLEAETLRNFLITNMQKKREKPKNSSASVLKEAVRRLKEARNASDSPLGRIEMDTEKDLSRAINDMAKVHIGSAEIARIRVKSLETLRESPKIEFGTSELNQHEVVLAPVGTTSSEEGVSHQVCEEIGSLETDFVEKTCENDAKMSGILSEGPNQSQEPEEHEIVCNSKENLVNSELVVEPNQKLEPVLENEVKEIEVCPTSTSEKSVLPHEQPAIASELNKTEGEEAPEQLSSEPSPKLQEEAIEKEVVKELDSNLTENSIENEETTKKIPLEGGSVLEMVEPEIATNESDLPKANEPTLPIETVASETAPPLNGSCAQTLTNDLETNIVPQCVAESKIKRRARKDSNKEKPNTTETPVSQSEPEPKRKPILSKPVASPPTTRQVKIGPKSIRVQIQQKKPLNTTSSKALTSPKTQIQKTLPTTVAAQKKELPKTFAAIAPPRTKIVKPNKVINQPTVDLKRKTVDANASQQPIPAKKPKIIDDNRLVTSAEIPQHPELIIRLRASESESEYSDFASDDFVNEEETCVPSFFNRSLTIATEYYDIASPISLPMESPCDTPLQSGSPIVSRTQTPAPPPLSVEKSIVNDYFEAKLEQFLKNVRTKVSDKTMRPPTQSSLSEGQEKAVVNSTPVAVRHLPEASQQEYRRLINRMKMLERQKQAKNLQVSVKASEAGAASPTMTPKKNQSDGKLLVRKVLVKNATAKPSTDIAVVAVQKPTEEEQSPQKPLSPNNVKSKENLLVLYENSYQKTGASIISSLDKSLEMVMEVKRAKMVKLQQEQRLRELRKEMDEVQKNLKEQQEKITKIYPEICNSHRTVESLKTRRLKINKAVTALGKSVIGPSYSIKNNQKAIIQEKSRKLAAEIKLVNTMKLSDLESLDNRKPFESSKAVVELPAEDLETSIIEKHQTESSPEAADVHPNEQNEPSSQIETPKSSDEQLSAQQANSKPSTPNPASPKISTNDDVTTVVCDKNNQSPEIAEDDSIENPASDKEIVPEALDSHKDDLMGSPPANEHEEEEEEEGEQKEVEEALELVQPDVVNCIVISDSDNSNDNYEQSPDRTTIINMDASVKEEENGDNNLVVGCAKLQEYVSPLSHWREERHINPNGIVCPYQLRGQCDDKDCQYMHLED